MDNLQTGFGTDAHLSTNRERERLKSSEPHQKIHYIHENHRIIATLFADGLSNRQVQEELTCRGIKLSYSYICKLRKDPLVATRVAELQGQMEVEVVDLRKEREQMANDAMDILHQASLGYVERPVINEEGQLVEDQVMYEPVPVGTRISAAKSVTERHPDTAPVQKNQTTHDFGFINPERGKKLVDNCQDVMAKMAELRAQEPPLQLEGEAV